MARSGKIKSNKPNKGSEVASSFYFFYIMDQKFKNSSPRIKIIQKIYNSLMNPNDSIEYPKNQYKKFIKDVVSGTLERNELIEHNKY